MNLVLGLGKNFTLFNIDWFVWAALLWTFIFLVHLINVFLLGSFMNKQWENKQIEKLVQKQKDRISKLEDKIIVDNTSLEKKNPIPNNDLKTDSNTPL